MDDGKMEAEPRLISKWSELAELPESESHRLEISRASGWLIAKNPKDICGDGDTLPDDWYLYADHYLSTHTFYGSKHEHSTELLRKCGFNVEIANWDAES